MKILFRTMYRLPTQRLRQSPAIGRYRYVRRRWRVLFTIVDAIGETVARRLPRFFRSADSAASSPRSILLVQLDHLGDALLTAAVLPDLRRRFPAAQVEVLATPWNREVFESSAHVDRVHVSRWNRFAGGWRPGWLLATLAWGWRLRRRFDAAIDVRGEFPQAALLWLTGTRCRVGWDCGGGGFLLTHRAAFVHGRPEIESRLALLALLGVQPSKRLMLKRPWFDAGDDARLRISQRLRALDEAHLGARLVGQGPTWGATASVAADAACNPLPGSSPRRTPCAAGPLTPNEPLIVLHIGGGSQAKRWPAAHWHELLGRIVIEYGARVVLIGSKSEQSLARAITLSRPWPGVTDWTGELSLRETAALVERAVLLIGADSGPAHLAAAVGTAAIVLFSGTNRMRQWRPWGRRVLVARHRVTCSPCHRRRCPLANHPCMTGLTPEAVMQKMRRVLVAADVSDRVKGPALRSLHTASNEVLRRSATFLGRPALDDLGRSPYDEPGPASTPARTIETPRKDNHDCTLENRT